MNHPLCVGRRTLLRAGFALPFAACFPAAPLLASGVPQVRVNIPGPGSLPFLPVELMPLLGFDVEMEFRQVTRYHPSGVACIEDMLAGNADLAAGGFSVLPQLVARGKDVVAVSPLSCRAMHFGLVVRRDLAGKIRKPADLAGRTLGIALGSAASKSYPQMVCELFLARAGGVRPDQLRWLGVTQKWEPIAGAMASGSVDAVFVEEPFKSRLVAEKLGVMLADLGDERVAAVIPGPGHLRSVIATRRAWVADERIGRFVRALRRTLVWMRSAKPEDIVAPLPVDAQTKRVYAAVLRRLPEMFSPTGQFRPELIAATDEFVRAVGIPFAGSVAALIDDRWAGKGR